MVARSERRRLVPHIRARETPGVRELQSEIEIAIRVRPKSLAMRRHQRLAQARDRRLRRRRQHQLMRIGAAVLADRDGFASPHQFCAADAEIPPSASCQVGRFAILRAVPPFHRQNAEAVAHAHAVDLNRLREGARRVDGVVELKCDLRTFEMGAKRRRAFSATRPWDTGCGSPEILCVFELLIS